MIARITLALVICFVAFAQHAPAPFDPCANEVCGSNSACPFQYTTLNNVKVVVSHTQSLGGSEFYNGPYSDNDLTVLTNDIVSTYTLSSPVSLNTTCFTYSMDDGDYDTYQFLSTNNFTMTLGLESGSSTSLLSPPVLSGYNGFFGTADDDDEDDPQAFENRWKLSYSEPSCDINSDWRTYCHVTPDASGSAGACQFSKGWQIEDGVTNDQLPVAPNAAYVRAFNGFTEEDDFDGYEVYACDKNNDCACLYQFNDGECFELFFPSVTDYNTYDATLSPYTFYLKDVFGDGNEFAQVTATLVSGDTYTVAFSGDNTDFAFGFVTPDEMSVPSDPGSVYVRYYNLVTNQDAMVLNSPAPFAGMTLDFGTETDVMELAAGQVTFNVTDTFTFYSDIFTEKELEAGASYTAWIVGSPDNEFEGFWEILLTRDFEDTIQVTEVSMSYNTVVTENGSDSDAQPLKMGEIDNTDFDLECPSNYYEDDDDFDDVIYFRQ